MAKNIKGITIEINGETSGLEKALGNVNQKSKEIQKELKNVENLLKFNPKNTELMAQKQQLLTDAVANTSEKLKILKDTEQQVNEQFKKGEISQQQYNDFRNEVIKTESQLKSLETQLRNVNDRWNDSAKALGEFGKKTEAMGKKIAPISKVAGGALTAIVGLGIKAGASADEINTLSKQTGLSVENIQKFQMASELVDVPLETMTGALAKVTKGLGKAREGTGPVAEAYAKLGVNIKDSSGNLRSAEEVFYDSIDALGKIENVTDRDIVAMELFGKSAQDLNPLIMGGADALREMGIQADLKGLILSQEEIDKANELNDVLETIKGESMQGLMQIGADLAPVLIPIFQAIGDGLKTVIGYLQGLDENTMKSIIIILGVITAIAPVLIVIGKVAMGLSAVMKIVGALGPVITLLTGPFGLVVLAIGALIAIGVILYKNWDKIKLFAQSLGESLKNTFNNIKTSIITAFTGLITGIQNIWSRIVSFMTGLPAQMVNFGKNIIQGLINGIKAKLSAVTDAVKNVASAITGKIKNLLGIHSPSKVMLEMGVNTGAGFVQGIESMVKGAKESAQRMAENVQIATTPQETNSTMTYGGSMDMNININGEGASTLNNDTNFVAKVKTAILTEIAQGNRSIPNQTGLIPIL